MQEQISTLLFRDEWNCGGRTVSVPVHVFDPTGDKCIAPQFCGAFMRARLPVIISFHFKEKNRRTTGIRHHGLPQRVPASHSTQGTTPVSYRGLWSLQVNQTCSRVMQ